MYDSLSVTLIEFNYGEPGEQIMGWIAEYDTADGKKINTLGAKSLSAAKEEIRSILNLSSNECLNIFVKS